jgi:biotin transport system substrate-specific component
MKNTRALTLAFFLSLALGFIGQFEFSFWNGMVPFSFQSLAVILIAGIFDPKVSLYTVLFYLLEGVLGLPVFAGKKFGLMTLIGPTGGYLFGFVLCTWFIGKTRSVVLKTNSFTTILIQLLIGQGLIFLAGVLYLTKFMSFEASIQIGLMPFILTDVTKTIIASTIIYQLKSKLD